MKGRFDADVVLNSVGARRKDKMLFLRQPAGYFIHMASHAANVRMKVIRYDAECHTLKGIRSDPVMLVIMHDPFEFCTVVVKLQAKPVDSAKIFFAS